MKRKKEKKRKEKEEKEIKCKARLRPELGIERPRRVSIGSPQGQNEV
jgi:hypothetical protein